MASTSFSSTASQEEHQVKKYDVFVSFRGEDIRYGFLTHLSAALHRKKITTFIDHKLEKGEMISEALFKAIKNSKLSIIIFSKNFAFSTWCLKEVAEIIRCRKRMEQMVVPVFYHVDPSHVRNQTENFADAFAGHEQKYNKEKVEKWRSALTTASSILGWHQASATRSENELVEDIVGAVLKKLIRKSSNDTEGLVGMDSLIKQIEWLLCVGSANVCMLTVGIWGMGGIGKTAVAEAIFHRISCHFESCCFLENVKEAWEKYNRVYLQGKLLSAILGDIWDENMNKASYNVGHKTFIKDRLCRSKVLIVLDNVDNVEQLESLVGEFDCFGFGSRIIITTRDKQVVHGRVDEIYEIKALSDSNALQLFSRSAFKKNNPPKDLEELSSTVAKYADGNPLALKVMGAALFCKSKEIWKSALNKLEKSPLDEIQEKLRISYDGLGKEERRIFLDIACFFKGDNKDDVTRILDGCGFHTRFGISILVDKSLIYVQENMIQMHDLLQQMGRAIVLDESQQLGKRSRLWIPKEACDVLRKNKGTEAIEGIILDLSGLNDVHFPAKTFERMEKLRVLKIYDSNQMSWYFRHFSGKVCKVHLSQGLDCLPEELRCLWWHRYPLKCLPSNFDPENLVDLDLRYSDIEEPWNGVQDLPSLKFFDLSDSKRLIKTPNFSSAPNLLRVILSGCTELHDVHSSIWALDKLTELNMSFCKEVRSFPKSIHLKSLETLILSGCSNLTKFPEILRKMECLQNLFLEGTAIKEVPSSIENLTGLLSLRLNNCRRLKSLPSNISKLESLQFLDVGACSELESLPSSIYQLNSIISLCLSGCSKLESFPEISEITKELSDVHLNGTSMKEVPFCESSHCSSSDQNFTDLVPFLYFTSLNSLSCNLLQVPRVLAHLRMLRLSGSDIVRIPPCIKQLPDLRFLDLENCRRLQSLPELPPSIVGVDAHNCSQLKTATFPSISLTPRISNIFNFDRTMHWVFKFSDCLELDQDQRINIQEEALRQIKLIATQFLEYRYQKGGLIPGLHPLLGVLLPESEFLQCFSNQSMGSYVTILQLPLDWLKCKFMEFAVCAVFESKIEIPDGPDFLECHCTFKTEVGNISFYVPFFQQTVCASKLLVSDHLFLGYAALVMDEWPSKCYPYEASFQISMGFYKVKKCGVHLVCAQDKKERNPSMVMEGSSSCSENFCVRGFHEEPQPKRLKHLEFH